MAITILDSGLRINEALSVTKTDINFEQLTITVMGREGSNQPIVGTVGDILTVNARIISTEDVEIDWNGYSLGGQFANRFGAQDLQLIELSDLKVIGAGRFRCHASRITPPSRLSRTQLRPSLNHPPSCSFRLPLLAYAGGERVPLLSDDKHYCYGQCFSGCPVLAMFQ